MCATSSAQDQQGIAVSLHVIKQYSSWYSKVNLIVTLDNIDIRERRNEGPHAAGPDRKWLQYPPNPKVNGLPKPRANSNDATSVLHTSAFPLRIIDTRCGHHEAGSEEERNRRRASVLH